MPERRAMVVAAAILAFLVPLVVALGERDEVAFRFASGHPGAPLRLEPGHAVCQRAIDVPVDFAGVRVPGHGADVRAVISGDRDAGGRVGVCLRSSRPVRLVAVPATVAPESRAELDGDPAYVDVRLDFVRRDPATLGARLGEIRDRVTLFKPWWVAPVTVVALALTILVGVPLLIAAAVARR